MHKTLPWEPGRRPLMLAPMQGVTNRALRALFIEQAHPDTVFTEFMPVCPGAKHGISVADRAELAHSDFTTPLVVQLIGRNSDALVAAAVGAQANGAKHININMGCPYARPGKNGGGGALLRDAALLRRTLPALRAAIAGSFSVKLRAGYEDPEEVFALLPQFEDAGVDFLILHARTVLQKYNGPADHSITKEVCRRTSLPLIANGDINCAEFGHRLLEETGAAGLMLARGAIADPWLFHRLRGERPTTITIAERRAELCEYLRTLCNHYCRRFSDESVVLYRVKDVLNHIHYEWFEESRRALRRCKQLDRLTTILESLG